MADSKARQSRRLREAADWFTRMNTSTTPHATVDAFFAWRRDPANRAAYTNVEAIGRTVHDLRDDPDIQAAVLQARQRRPWWRSLTSGWRAPTVAAAGLFAAASLATYFVVTPALQGQRYGTAVGQQQTIHLSDGSSVRLDTDSQIQVHIGGNVRRVVLLRGQAFFDVSHDAARPFIVDAGGAEIRDLGTRFDVRRAADSVAVTLAEGKVQVRAKDGAGQSWMLAPGQRIQVGGGRTAPSPEPANLDTTTAWTTGRLLFRDAPLADAVAEMNRYSVRKIVLAAGTPTTVRVNGAFGTGDVDGFIAGATDGLNLSASRLSDGNIELRPRETSAQ